MRVPRCTILVLALLIVGGGFFAFSSVGQTPAPLSGDWVITNSTKVADAEITLTGGDLVVKSELELSNVTLLFDMSTDGQHGIYIEAGGKLTVSGGSSISASRSAYRFSFSVEGDVFITDTEISDIYGGVQLQGGDLELLRTTLSGSSSHGVEADGGTLRIQDCTFSNNKGVGIRASGGTPLIAGTMITGSQDEGVWIDGGASAEVVDSTIHDNGGSGIRIDSSSGLVSNNTITSNGGDGVSCANVLQGLTVKKNTMLNNNGYGIRSTGGEPGMGLNVMVQGNDDNILGQVFQAWRLAVKVKGMGGDPKVGASVEVTSRGIGGNQGTILTNASGEAAFSTLLEYRLLNNGTEMTDSNYDVKVTLSDADSGAVSERQVSMTQNRHITFTLDPADLVLTDLVLSDKEVDSGDDLEISAIVSNTGGVEAKNITVTFYDGSKAIKDVTIESLQPGSSQEVATKWDTGGASTGKHTVKVIVDPGDEITETNETNNAVTGKVEVNMSPLFRYAIPLMLLLAVGGIGAFNFYRWVVIKRIKHQQGEDTEGYDKTPRKGWLKDRKGKKSKGKKKRTKAEK